MLIINSEGHSKPEVFANDSFYQPPPSSDCPMQQEGDMWLVSLFSHIPLPLLTRLPMASQGSAEGREDANRKGLSGLILCNVVLVSLEGGRCLKVIPFLLRAPFSSWEMHSMFLLGWCLSFN